MLGANLFFKKPEFARSMVYTHQDAMRDAELRAVRDKYNQPNNTGARPFVGNPKFGFHTMLDRVKVPLPTAPAVVGGNVDWTKARVTPATQHLYDSLNVGRPMNPPPALGSLLRLGEPVVNSIHTTY